jgi:hypothetical protein
MKLDSQQKPYFINHIDKITTYNDPRIVPYVPQITTTLPPGKKNGANLSN